MLFDTRFFISLYHSKDAKQRRDLIEIAQASSQKWVSAITVYEVYVVSQELEGREVAKMRVDLLIKDFKVKPVDAQIARVAAELNHDRKVPMADAIIAATAKVISTVCITDDPHFKELEGIKTKWIS
ncbi:MAG: PIN domain-containing protein [Nitrososphaerota archaeon]|jgi:predicted nucleic acid-binding protein|nr:PIN domain-containing protein [Nitrososphaerota archaeon]MDG6936512.1 PIN domain-containing protein [Nitrososphaerota archaeon]MDG6944987.1 PIN domain-containing protein [Nitrososphaerota archaeon]